MEQMSPPQLKKLMVRDRSTAIVPPLISIQNTITQPYFNPPQLNDDIESDLNSCITDRDNLWQVQQEFIHIRNTHTTNQHWQETLARLIVQVCQQLPQSVAHGHKAPAQCIACCQVKQAFTTLVNESTTAALYSAATVETVLAEQFKNISCTIAQHYHSLQFPFEIPIAPKHKS